jgi:NTE family protein
MRHAVLILIGTAAFLVAGTPQGEASEAPRARPTIGLVLSGGGARGAAHAGALKVIEELRIPVDYVVGTSMGAIVGGLYASGVSPDQIEAQLTAVDWDALFDDRPPRGSIPFRRKQEDWEQFAEFEVGLGGKGLLFPSGLISGQKLNYLLGRMTIGEAGVEDFDELPIPFRAVATDLNTGEMVVLGDGSLTQAMRASMAVPGLFTPVRLGGRTLVDGGVARSLPVDVVRSMGADVVIAVDISPGTEGPQGTESVGGVILQTLFVLLDQNVLEQRRALTDDDCLIVPDLKDVWVADFPKAARAIALGDSATRRRAADLARYSVSEAEYGAFLHRLRPGGAREPLRIDAVHVSGPTRVDTMIVRGAIRTRPGSVLDPGLLVSDLERVYELGDFELVDYRITDHGGSRILIIRAEEKSWGPDFLRVGFTLSSDLRERSAFTARARLLRTRINPTGGEWRALFEFGEETSIGAEIYQPMTRSNTWFVSPQVRWGRRHLDLYTAASPSGELLVERFAGRLDAGIQLRNHGEARIGVFRGVDDVDVRWGAPDPSSGENGIGGYAAALTIDQIDSPSFPRRGTFARLEGEFSRTALGADQPYDRVRLDFRSALTFAGNTFVASVEYGSSLDSDLPTDERFDLGGFRRLSGLVAGELRGNLLGLVGLSYYRRLVKFPGAVGSGLYAGASLEAGNVWEREEDAALEGLRLGGSVFVGASTIAGPAYLALGLTDGGNVSASFSAGGAPLPR